MVRADAPHKSGARLAAHDRVDRGHARAGRVQRGLVGVRVHQGIGIDRVVAVLGHVLAQTVQILNGMDPQNVVARGLRRLAIV